MYGVCSAPVADGRLRDSWGTLRDPTVLRRSSSVLLALRPAGPDAAKRKSHKLFYTKTPQPHGLAWRFFFANTTFQNFACTKSGRFSAHLLSSHFLGEWADSRWRLRGENRGAEEKSQHVWFTLLQRARRYCVHRPGDTCFQKGLWGRPGVLWRGIHPTGGCCWSKTTLRSGRHLEKRDNYPRRGWNANRCDLPCPPLSDTANSVSASVDVENHERTDSKVSNVILIFMITDIVPHLIWLSLLDFFRSRHDRIRFGNFFSAINFTIYFWYWQCFMSESITCVRNVSVLTISVLWWKGKWMQSNILCFWRPGGKLSRRIVHKTDCKITYIIIYYWHSPISHRLSKNIMYAASVAAANALWILKYTIY